MSAAKKNKSIILLEFEPYDRYGSQYINRGLKVNWTPEMIYDLQAFHAIDAEAELTALLTQEIAAEIDREIINNLFEIND